jgi:predicted ATPase
MSMKLRSLTVAGYRSLKSIRMEIGDVNVFVGDNGVGKSNLYRALHLAQAAAEGAFAREIAAEGGMAAVLWTGTRKKGRPVRLSITVELLDEDTALGWRYTIDAGLTPPMGAGFPFEPQIKEERLSIDQGRRVVDVMKRAGQGLSYRDADGRMQEYPIRLLSSETGLAALGGSGLHAEAAIVRDTLARFRFYHGFRSDAGSPLRAASLAVTAPMLDMDGSNLAAVMATLKHIRGDTVDLDRAVADAFKGAWLDIPLPDREARFGVVFPQFPQRVFSAAELSDGQIRFLGLAAALLAYRIPPFIALNEPEASLHPSMLASLADMIARAAKDAQIWVVTHAPELADLIVERTGVRAKTVIRQEDGSTWIEGMRLTGQVPDEADEMADDDA